MGFFGGGDKKKAAEEMVKLSLSKVDVVNLLVANLVNDENNKWITNCQGYYDNRSRNVIVKEDLVKVEWKNIFYENNTKREEMLKEVAYRFTDAGYRPLHEYKDEKGNVVLTAEKVVNLLATVIAEKLKAAVPSCEISEVIGGQGYSRFTIDIPALSWKDWF